jgi:hypothetical protein
MFCGSSIDPAPRAKMRNTAPAGRRTFASKLSNSIDRLAVEKDNRKEPV